MITKYSKLLYAAKIWLFSVFGSPIMMLGLGVPKRIDSLSETVETYQLMIIFGGLFSLPSLLIFMIAIYFFTRNRKKNKEEQKMSIQIIAVILCLAPIFIFFALLENSGIGADVMLISSFYLATISFGIWFFDYKMSHLIETEEIDDLLI